MSAQKHPRTCAIQKSIETRAKAPLVWFDSRKYIQHNLNLGDGLGPILELMDALPADRTTVTPLRSFDDGDFSVAHLDYTLGDWGPMVGFEVHRWKDDRIVEHWDNLQPTPGAPNPSGRTMIDGPTGVADLERTDANKALVRRYTETVLVGGELDRFDDFFDDDALVQHAPDTADGVPALRDRLNTALAGSVGPRHERLHRVLGSGDTVLAMSEGTNGSAGAERVPAALYDLYRIVDGRIAEHWEVIETIPPREAWQNDNGKF